MDAHCCTINLFDVDIKATFVSNFAIMTEVAASGSRGYSHGVGNTLSTPIMAAAAPKIEMQPNPEFYLMGRVPKAKPAA